MSKFFSPRSLIFYGGSIGFVMVLFSVVSAYGEANLKAPNHINGRYPIAASNLPGCLQNQSLVLLVQQSGVFLNGSLVPLDAPEKVARIAEERPSLTGHWDNRTLTLQGTTAYLPDCSLPINLQGSVEDNSLKGTIRLTSSSETAPFTASREVTQEKQQEGGH
ncbi:hypothetical protein [Pantanalinema sp. GBBB05]|uniref:hypothetical protein n=1 Tax=Pantanalinema sp. GBBB05 TaxID=2604139 RepID=UPI001D540E08|nr:hypothetical protein [Pantanalinema sp. GBBB05]